jgi:hypothetical protein
MSAVGPSMSTKRGGHSCAMFKSALHGNVDVVAVVGGNGVGWDPVETSEFLIVGTDNWTKGKAGIVVDVDVMLML